MRSKGLIVQKHYVTAAAWAARLKRIIPCRLRIPKRAQTHGDVGISFFSFFYFDVFVLNSEPCKKWFPHRHWRCLVTPFRDVNYGSGEVRVSLFVLVVACVLVLEVKSWKTKKSMKNDGWFWFSGEFWQKIMDYILIFLKIFILKFQSMSSSISRSSIFFN